MNQKERIYKLKKNPDYLKLYVEVDEKGKWFIDLLLNWIQNRN